MAKVKYRSTVYNQIQANPVKQEIIDSVQSSPDLRNEIRRVFQVANRRIQNIEKQGGYSPALESLGELPNGFTKFSMQGEWNELKEKYGRAIAFLRQPTSTATGTRQYNEHIRQAYDLSNDEFKLMTDYFKGKLNSVKGVNFVEKYLMRYKDFTGEFEREVSSLADQIESDAASIADALQNDVDETVSDLYDDEFSQMLDALEIDY